MDDKITVENVNVPGYTTRVSKTMYEAMHQAMWKVLPVSAPGLTQSEIFEAVVPFLPQDLFPGGAKAGMVGKDGPTGSRGQGYPDAREDQALALASNCLMDINPLGITAALSAFLGIWLGHVAVRKIEFISPTIWKPSLAFVVLGLFLEYCSLATESISLKTALGIVGITLLWDALVLGVRD